MDIVIRKGTLKDLPAAYSLIKELSIYENSESELTLSQKQFIEDAQKTPGYFNFILAETNNHLVGLVLFFDHYSTWKGKCLYIEDLIVTSEYRRNGIGTMLLKAVATYSLDNFYDYVLWQVSNGNQSAISFYESIGAAVDNGWYNCSWTNENLKQFLRIDKDNIQLL